MKIYRVAVTMREDGYVEVEAENEAEAFERAELENEAGGFVGYVSECDVGEIIEVRDIPCRACGKLHDNALCEGGMK